MMPLQIVSYDQAIRLDVSWPDIYFEPAYGRAEEFAGSGRWRCVVGGNGSWLMPFHTQTDELAQDAASPYGYAGVYADDGLTTTQRAQYWDATLSVLQRAGITSLFLRQSPLFPGPFDRRPGRVVVSSHQTFAIRLATKDVMWAAMEGRARTSIRKAERNGLDVAIRPADENDLSADSPFRGLYRSVMERRGARSRYFFTDQYYTALLLGLSEPPLLAEVRDFNGTVVAGAIFLRHQSILHYHLSAATPDAGRSGATNLLIWAAAKYGAEQNLTRLHLGGGLKNGDGLARFKRAFGGDILFYNAYGVVVDPRRYAAAMTASVPGISSGSTGYFPAYRRSE